jgi:exonuclease SbcC
MDANAVVVSGRNGTGKTSLFDAVLWGLTGAIPRLSAAGADAVVSMYSDSGTARVAVDFIDDKGGGFQVARSIEPGRASVISVVKDNEVLVGDEGLSSLVRSIGLNSFGSDQSNMLAGILTRAIYLEQDTLRQFIDADSDTDRYELVGRLIGVGQVTELQHALERQRNAWTKATNERRSTLEAEKRRLSDLSETLRRTEPEVDQTSVRNRLLEWSEQAGRLGLTRTEHDAMDARAFDTLARELIPLRSRVNHGLGALERIRVLRESAPKSVPDSLLHAAEDRRSKAQEALATARDQLARAQAAAAAARRRAEEQQEERAQLASLARLASRHLGDRCPVCTQAYDRSATESHLRELMAAEEAPVPVPTNQVSRAAQTTEAAERALAGADREVAELRSLIASRARWELQLGDAARDAGIPIDLDDAQLLGMVEQERTRQDALEALARAADNLAIDLAAVGVPDRRADLTRQLNEVGARVEATRRDVSSRDETGLIVGTILEALRGAADDFVTAQLDSLTPLLDRIYGRIDPHPALTKLQLKTRIWHARGRLDTALIDTAVGKGSDYPAAVLSSSQLNAVATSIFLAMNLGLNQTNLEFVLLDDPLQSLDDVHLLGLVDLLRRLKDRRQVVISTHDSSLATLLLRKLRAVGDADRTLGIEIGPWHRDGPTVQYAEAVRDEAPYRLVVA